MQGLRDTIVCPITRQVFLDPVILSSGITFEKCEIIRWLEIDRKCPITKKVIRKYEKKHLTENLLVKQIISELLSNGYLKKSEIYKPVFNRDEFKKLFSLDYEYILRIDLHNYEKIQSFFVKYSYEIKDLYFISGFLVNIPKDKAKALANTLFENATITRDDYLKDLLFSNFSILLRDIDNEFEIPYDILFSKMGISSKLTKEDVPLFLKVTYSNSGFDFLIDRFDDYYLSILDGFDEQEFDSYINSFIGKMFKKTFPMLQLKFILERFGHRFKTDIIISMIKRMEKFSFFRMEHIDFLKFLLSLNYYEVSLYIRSDQILSTILSDKMEYPFYVSYRDLRVTYRELKNSFYEDNSIAVSFEIDGYPNSLFGINSYDEENSNKTDRIDEVLDMSLYDYCDKKINPFDYQDIYKKQGKGIKIKSIKKK